MKNNNIDDTDHLNFEMYSFLNFLDIELQNEKNLIISDVKKVIRADKKFDKWS